MFIAKCESYQSHCVDLLKTMKMLTTQGFDWKVVIDEVGPLGSGDMFYERGHTEWAHEDTAKTHYNK